ncbi:hypothetical protein ACLB2K_011885 [Fragaria x ananassa]
MDHCKCDIMRYAIPVNTKRGCLIRGYQVRTSGRVFRPDFRRFSTIPASATPFLLPGVITNFPRQCWNEEEGRRDRDQRSTMIGREVLSEVAAWTSDRNLSGLLLHSNIVGGGLRSRREEETASPALEWWRNDGNPDGKPVRTSLSETY